MGSNITKPRTIDRRDSMFLSFRMGQAAGGPARGQRLCDIDPVL